MLKINHTRRTCLLVLAVAACTGTSLAQAQSADDVYNKYLDFNLARLQGENSKVLEDAKIA